MTPRRKGLLAVALNPVLVALLVCLVASPAYAAKPAGKGGGGKGGGGGGSSTPTGIDVSYPQCGSSLPSGEAFAIVGVNGGLANDYNSCLKSEFGYAQNSTGSTSQPKAQLYVNTADPSNTVNDWPYGTDYSTVDPLGAYATVSSSGSTPYGGCTSYTNTAACAYVYGYDMAAGVASDGDKDAADNSDSDVDIPGDVSYFETATGASASGSHWWLDVETANSWQSGSTGQQMNVADLQGMVAALQAAGVSYVGVYSTGSQWNTITGTPGSTISYNNTTITSTLYGLPVWIPGARSLGGAESNCSLSSFTDLGGSEIATLTQWFGHPYDGDYACS